MITTRLDVSTDCVTKLDDVERVNAFINNLSDDDIKRINGDGVNRVPVKPFKPIR